MPRQFSDVLRDLRGGMAADEATDALARVVRMVEETGKPGELTIKLTVRRASKAALTIRDLITTKLPKEDGNETLMFASTEGSLLREDPRQAKLDLKMAPGVVAPTPAELKQVG